ncbi:MAG: DUF1751 domain-containing protein [Myxococcaceae bacterium]
MRPMRGGGGGYGQFLNMRNVSFKMAVAVVVGSIVNALMAHHAEAPYLSLIPSHVIPWVWEPFTYGFVANDPLGVLFGALIVWQMGSTLEMTWGSRRLLVFALGTTVVAGVLTVLLSRLPGLELLRDYPFAGSLVLGSALWVGYGLAWGTRMTNFWGMPLSGNAFAGIGVLFVVLQAAFSGWQLVIPDVIAIAITFVYVRYGSAGMWFTRFRAWQLQRRLKSRGKHLHVISKDRNELRPKDDYLN